MTLLKEIIYSGGYKGGGVGEEEGEGTCEYTHRSQQSSLSLFPGLRLVFSESAELYGDNFFFVFSAGDGHDLVLPCLGVPSG